MSVQGVLTVKRKPAIKYFRIALASAGIILVIGIITWLNLTWRPDVSGLPADSGFYAYIGKAILHGQILYRDVWDDKPPLGYYLNASALAIFGQTTFGVWWSSVIWISGCAVLLFFLIKKLFGGATAGITTGLFLVALMNPQLFAGGNLMEVYALFPQIAVIGVTYYYFKNKENQWLALSLGGITATAYLIKQPTLVLGCASILMILAKSISQGKIRQAFLMGISFVGGFAGMVVLVAVYWLIVGAPGAFLDGAILQGFSFIGGAKSFIREYFFYTLVNVLPGLFIGKIYLIALLTGGIFLIEKLVRVWLKDIRQKVTWWEWSLVGALLIFPIIASRLWPRSYLGKPWLISIFAIGLIFFVEYYRRKPRPVNVEVFTLVEWTWLAGLVALPLELLMASLGGRYFGHYFITMIPAVCLVVAYPIWRTITGVITTIKDRGAMLPQAAYLVPFFLTMIWGGYSTAYSVPPKIYTDHLASIFTNKNVLNSLDEYIVQSTKPDDEVLVWHIHLGINFVTDRKAPARVLFPLNLFIPPSDNNTRLKEFVDGLESKPPELILFQKFSSISLPFVDQPIDQECLAYCTPEFVQALEVPQIRQQWIRLQEFVQQHYALDSHIYDWTIYRKIP